MSKVVRKPKNHFIQLLSLGIVVLGLSASLLLVQQKIVNPKAYTANEPNQCPTGKVFCGGCIQGCRSYTTKNCNQWIAEECFNQRVDPTPPPQRSPIATATPRSATPAPSPTSIIYKCTKLGQTKCGDQIGSPAGLPVVQICAARSDGNTTIWEWQTASKSSMGRNLSCGWACFDPYKTQYGCADTLKNTDEGAKVCDCLAANGGNTQSYTPTTQSTSKNADNVSTGAKAVDGNVTTAWSSGAFAPQWIRIDLGKEGTVSKIKLTPNQTPNGNTVHKVYVSQLLPPANSFGTLVHTFSGNTSNGVPIEKTFSPSLTKVRYVTIQTTTSPSWVAWSEIQIWP